MRKIAQSTCESCHYIFPRDEMVRTVLSERSGSSVGLSTNLTSKNNRSNPRGSGRVYYRNRKVWICSACHKSNRRSEWLSFMFWAVVIVVSVVFLSE